jgi:hypothetical protein
VIHNKLIYFCLKFYQSAKSSKQTTPTLDTPIGKEISKVTTPALDIPTNQDVSKPTNSVFNISNILSNKKESVQKNRASSSVLDDRAAISQQSNPSSNIPSSRDVAAKSLNIPIAMAEGSKQPKLERTKILLEKRPSITEKVWYIFLNLLPILFFIFY